MHGAVSLCASETLALQEKNIDLNSAAPLGVCLACMLALQSKALSRECQIIPDSAMYAASVQHHEKGSSGRSLNSKKITRDLLHLLNSNTRKIHPQLCVPHHRNIISAPVQLKGYSSMVQFGTTTSPTYTGEVSLLHCCLAFALIKHRCLLLLLPAKHYEQPSDGARMLRQGKWLVLSVQPGATLTLPADLPAVAAESAGGVSSGAASQNLAPSPASTAGCTPTPYQLLESEPDASTFLRLANETGAIPFRLSLRHASCGTWSFSGSRTTCACASSSSLGRLVHNAPTPPAPGRWFTAAQGVSPNLTLM